ncbi:MAG TPA: DUF1648 domain-containing protein [Bacillota bacterium]|nr:DUF1648 domain-containing protein [Bacillota bacterium]
MDSLQWKGPQNEKTKFFNIVTVVVMIASIIYMFYIYPKLPEEIPVHFNIQGEADGWGGKASILIFPLMILFPAFMGFVFGRYGHFLYSGELSEKDKRIFVLTYEMITKINTTLAFITFYSLWMVKQEAFDQMSFAPWSIFLFLAILAIIIIQYFIQYFRVRKAG